MLIVVELSVIIMSVMAANTELVNFELFENIILFNLFQQNQQTQW